MSDSKRTIENLSSAVQKMREAADVVANSLQEFESLAKKSQKVDELSQSLSDLQQQFDALQKKYDRITEALTQALRAACERVLRTDLSAEEKIALTEAVKDCYSALESIGFYAIIPKPGDKLDQRHHVVRGQSGDDYLSTQVSDVVEWGYWIEDGQQVPAEVLAGVLAEGQRRPKEGMPEPKAGISMVLEPDESTGDPVPTVSNDLESDMFRKLKEAAEKNREQQ